MSIRRLPASNHAWARSLEFPGSLLIPYISFVGMFRTCRRFRITKDRRRQLMLKTQGYLAAMETSLTSRNIFSAVLFWGVRTLGRFLGYSSRRLKRWGRILSRRSVRARAIQILPRSITVVRERCLSFFSFCTVHPSLSRNSQTETASSFPIFIPDLKVIHPRIEVQHPRRGVKAPKVCDWFAPSVQHFGV